MTRSQKILLAFASGVFLLIAILIYDVSTRTTFPGSKKQKNAPGGAVTMPVDTSKSTHR